MIHDARSLQTYLHRRGWTVFDRRGRAIDAGDVADAIVAEIQAAERRQRALRRVEPLLNPWSPH